MDWGHVALGAALLIVIVVRGFQRRRRRSIEWTFRWEDQHDDSADGGG